MTILLQTLFLFATLTTLFGQTVEQLSGFYSRKVRCAGCGDHLDLKTDSTFKLTYNLDWSSIKIEGKWTIKQETVYLYTKAVHLHPIDQSQLNKTNYKFKITKTLAKDIYRLKDKQLNIFSLPVKKKYFIKHIDNLSGQL